MNKIIVATILVLNSLITKAYADVEVVPSAIGVGEGYYFGFTVGKTNTHNVPQLIKGTDIVVTPSNTGAGGRIFMGYDINQNFAFELGATHYADSKYDISSTCKNATIQENAIDLVGVAMVPFYPVTLFGKFGAAFMFTNASGGIVSSSKLGCAKNNGSSSWNAMPTAAIGVSYALTPSWVVDLSWSRVFKTGDIQNADLIGIGFTYQVGNSYCGQFLC